MSYCVHCGVELEKTLESCPLCNTPVVDPKQAADTTAQKPYPTKRGQVTPVKNADTAILISVVLLSTAIACGLLNLLVFHESLWSLYIIGACALLWILFMPAMIYSKLPVYLSILFDGIAIALYVGIVAYQFPGEGWFFMVALPIIGCLTLCMLAFAAFTRHISNSILARAILFFAEVGILAVAIELIVRNHISEELFITWSTVVLTSCIIIAVALFTILKRSRLRNEIRRRMHL